MLVKVSAITNSLIYETGASTIKGLLPSFSRENFDAGILASSGCKHKALVNEVLEVMKVRPEEADRAAKLLLADHLEHCVLDTSRGLVVLTGCSHPGIVDILRRVKEIRNSPIHLVFGGFHLMNAPDASIQGLLAAFEELGVERCGATHCTGDRQIELIKARFGDRYVPMGTGRVIEVPGPGRGAS
jgi:hypothetical protein